jgi:hypothetical protein
VRRLDATNLLGADVLHVARDAVQQVEDPGGIGGGSEGTAATQSQLGYRRLHPTVGRVRYTRDAHVQRAIDQPHLHLVRLAPGLDSTVEIERRAVEADHALGGRDELVAARYAVHLRAHRHAR